jgi:hypothetical protein
MSHTPYEQFIMMDNCCMKKEMKALIRPFTNKPFTDIQLMLLCIYQMILLTTMCMAIVQFQIVARCLVWIFAGGIIPNHIIIMTILFINIMIMIQVIENTIKVVEAFICKCDYRQHPELIQE